jgi:hypothetical protein
LQGDYNNLKVEMTTFRLNSQKRLKVIKAMQTLSPKRL